MSICKQISIFPPKYCSTQWIWRFFLWNCISRILLTLRKILRSIYSIYYLRKLQHDNALNEHFGANYQFFHQNTVQRYRHGNFSLWRYESRIHLTLKNISSSIKHVTEENPFMTRPWMSIFGEKSSVFP